MIFKKSALRSSRRKKQDERLPCICAVVLDQHGSDIPSHKTSTVAWLASKGLGAMNNWIAFIIVLILLAIAYSMAPRCTKIGDDLWCYTITGQTFILSPFDTIKLHD